MQEIKKYKHFGVMIDCSRNGVMNVKSVKKYIDILEKLGYNTLMLYTEDTYEVDNQPFLGYLRGKYSQSELKEIDEYAKKYSIELIPCVQTLGHMTCAVRWKEYAEFTDVNDILLCEDERTYKLIDDIFTTLEKCFTSRLCNIGMDEAHMVGLGKYLDKHGYHNRSEIMVRHVKKVCEIAEKHGFSVMMWSDMFFRLANHGQYDVAESNFDKSVTSGLPDSLSLIYWDYYHKEQDHYNKMMMAHKQFDNDIWFAGGLWDWNGFAPRNGFTMNTIDAAIPAVDEQGIENVFFTLWGDDGQECSHFSVLPSLYYASQIAHGVSDIDKIKQGFYEMFGVNFDDFMLLDLDGTTSDSPRNNHNPEKYMFYSDCFEGFLDSSIPDDFCSHYIERAKMLENVAENNEFEYLFKKEAALCRVLDVKFTLGLRTRAAYKSKDKSLLVAVAEDYARLPKLIDEFYEKFEAQWFNDYKPFGFEVQQARIGGLKLRIESCKKRLQKYIDGKIDDIPELDEELLDEFGKGYLYFNRWVNNFTTNVMTH